MKYAPSIWDFQSNFFLVERAKDPYFLITRKGEILKSNKVGQRFLTKLLRTSPNLLETVLGSINEVVATPTKKAITLLFGKGRKRVLRAIPLGSGDGYLVEIDRV